MASHNSLERKIAAFNQVALLEAQGDDEFDIRELRNRQRCRRFFHAPKPATEATPPRNRATSTKDATENVINRPDASSNKSKPSKDPQLHLDAPSLPSPPKLRRVSSAPTAAARIIKGTPIAAQRKPRGRLQNLIEDQDSPVIIKETPLPAVLVRPRSSNSTTAGNMTPLPAIPAAALHLTRKASDQSPSAGAGLRKRKREPALSMRPAGEQIFRGLSFYYVPNDDVAPARRIRITKAREYGAVWSSELATASHVIVDKKLAFEDVKGILAKAGSMRAPVVVNEDYPIDCIQFRAVLDHGQKKYLLKGQPSLSTSNLGVDGDAASFMGSVSSSAKSLQLKPHHKDRSRWDYVPARTAETSPASSGPGVSVQVDSQPAVTGLDHIVDSLQDYERQASRSIIVQDEEGISGQADELSECISQMQEFKDLPLDIDEEDDIKGSTATDTIQDSDDSTHDTEDAHHWKKRKRNTTRSGRKDMTFEDRFACNQAGEKNAKSDNPNMRTIEVLQSMTDYYDRVNDHWRTTAYRKAISTLKRQETKISTEEEAFRLPNIGRRLAQKIEEITVTDKLERLEYARAEPMDRVLQLFLGIYGVGVRQASQWIAQGFRTLEELERGARLTANQWVGVEHYADLNTRIPRAEVRALGEVVKQAARLIDRDAELIIGGSYRRGAESSGDIDFIVTKRGTESTRELRGLLDKLTRQLEEDGFLVARLASSSGSSGEGSKWHGCCVLPRTREEDKAPVWRRIDFLLVPETERGAALIYFTGNDIFNRSMRLLASKKGMRLNQRGLYKDVLRGPGRVKVTEGELLEGRDERRIFEILGVKWREPRERWC